MKTRERDRESMMNEIGSVDQKLPGKKRESQVSEHIVLNPVSWSYPTLIVDTAIVVQTGFEN